MLLSRATVCPQQHESAACGPLRLDLQLLWRDCAALVVVDRVELQTNKQTQIADSLGCSPFHLLSCSDRNLVWHCPQIDSRADLRKVSLALLKLKGPLALSF